jgi:hypothetical protein
VSSLRVVDGAMTWVASVLSTGLQTEPHPLNPQPARSNLGGLRAL